MKQKTISIVLIVFVLASAFFAVKLLVSGEPDIVIYNRARKINPTCADWCADLQWEKPDVSRECLERVVATSSCKK